LRFSTNVRTTDLEPFGLEVHGLDLDSLDPERAEELRRLISGARVAVFRDQRIDDQGLVRFLSSLGELTFTDGETPVPDRSQLNVVSNVGRSTPPRSVFHTDTSYVRRPPAFTALRPVLLPSNGGATLFSDQVAVAARLPPRIRTWLQGRTLLHQASGLAEESEANRHPLFRRHPITGEIALYLSTPARCSQLSDVDTRTSTRVIEALYRRSTRPSSLYRHEWRAGDILIWDNRVTMHRADHNDVAGDRVLHRGMVLGEIPLAE